jgi:aromatic-amino-acid transaminase
MLEVQREPPADKIIALMELFKADDRAGKVDLGVGVYKDANGRTPVMRAVKAAEKRLWEAQETKSYVGLLGDLAFVDAMAGLIFGDDRPRDRLCGAQTPGGTGAIRQLFELVRRAAPEATVWYSEPTWPNHPAILTYLGMKARTYRYFDPATGRVDFEGMTGDLAGLRAGDVLLLHGCCHNPTGANLDAAQWQAVIDLVLATGAVPMIDLAYQGFGDGLEADVAGLRTMAAAVPEMLLAASCSKNFGLYRDRVGVAFALSRDAGGMARTRGNLATLNRLNYSFPPDHGAKVVEIILGDRALRADWEAELEEMRTTMLRLRTGLAEALRRATNSERFDFVADHRGMFSLMGATPEQVKALREDHGIYMVGDSRVNIAGLPASGLDRIAAAIAAVGA